MLVLSFVTSGWPATVRGDMDRALAFPSCSLFGISKAPFANEIQDFPFLNFIVSVRLAETFPDYAEGKLSRARARLVAADHLAGVAAKLRLGEYLLLGRGEEKTGGRVKINLQVDALEAMIAALYRDGGLEAARSFVERHVLPENLAAGGDELFSMDYKSALQELLQAGKGAPAEYRVVDETGPEHQKMFTVEATVEDAPPARGSGGSKKSAEQQAARVMLEQLGRKV